MKKYIIALSVIAAGILPLAALAQTAPLSVTGASSCMNFKTPIMTGAASANDPGNQVQVLNLQLALSKEGFNVDPSELGKFGKATKAAIKAFQEKYSDEILGPFGMTKGTGFPGIITRLKLQALYGCQAGAIIVPAGTVVNIAVSNLVLTSNGVSATVCNNGQNDLPVVPFRIRLNGINRDFDAVGAHKAQTCISDSWLYSTWGLAFDPGATFGAVVLIDPSGIYKNDTLQYPLNASASTTLNVPALSGVQLSVRTLSVKSTGVQATFCNLGTKTVTTYPVSITLNGVTKNFDVSQAYGSGQCAPVQWTFDNWGLTYTPGTVYNATVLVDPNHVYQTANDNAFDNVATVVGAP